MRLPIEILNIIYQYKMGMDFILLNNQRKKMKEQEIRIKKLQKNFNSIYFIIHQYKIGDKIININSQRCATITDIDITQEIRDISYSTFIIQYDDQLDVNWGISGEDLYEFRYYGSNRIYQICNIFFLKYIMYIVSAIVICILYTSLIHNYVIFLFLFGFNLYIIYYLNFSILKVHCIILLILFTILFVENIINYINLTNLIFIFVICVILSFILITIYTIEKLNEMRTYRDN